MSLNKVMLIGNLGKDPEVRYTKSGDAVANFTVATNERWKDKQGNRQERTEWHTVVAWRSTAEFVQNYLKKGRKVFVEGRLETRDWTDNQNVKRYRTEIIADNVQALDRQGEGAGADQGGGSGYSDYAQRGGQQGDPQQGGSQQGGGQQRSGQPSARQGGGQGSPQQGQGQPPRPDEEPYLEDDIPF